ncbi:MAG: type 1 glutamine amidotransferase [Anaerolineales bacterium]|nr:type 1 glutamine amidotransferase [Anaerolineales bacterium]
MRISVLTHIPFETPGCISRWAAERGHECTVVRLWAGEPPPDADAVDLLVSMGGPMGANDESRFPWLREEKRLICSIQERGKRGLGICLGAQVMAAALGARVRPNPGKEIGWFPVRLTGEGQHSPFFSGFPAEFQAFHWHADTFDIPPGSVRLAESAASRNQAFAAGGLLGLQFHLEVEAAGVRALLEHCRSDLQAAEWVQPREVIEAGPDSYAELHARAFALLDSLARN